MKNEPGEVSVVLLSLLALVQLFSPGRTTTSRDSLAQAMEYNVGDVVRCTWGTKPVEYEAKIIHVNSASREYFVHYQGWNKRYDEWISEKSIIGASRKKQSTPLRYDTPKVRHSRREKKLKKPIDWSPTSSASAALAAEKSAVEREQNKHHVPITKRRHSPAVSKAIKTLPALPVVATVDDMAEESVTSDEEDGGDDALPRSYIDVLAKEKKRAEKESQRKASPETTQQHTDPLKIQVS
ncbi:hypothetical protein COOONC_07640 [Cooperia oncophora]